MMEQSINIRIHPVLCGAAHRFVTIFIALFSLALAACVPTGQNTVNTDLFKDKEDFKTRAATLRPGLTKDAAFKALGIDPDKFQRLSLAEIQGCLYGNSQVQGSPEQLEAFRQRLMRYEGFSLPYRSMKSDGSLGFGTMKVRTTGQDMRIVIVFDGDKLVRATVEGTENVSQEENQYLWKSLISRGLGLAF
jgi:hypothetical protein